jgi:hypothetical protein
MEARLVLFEAAKEMGESDHVSFSGRLVIVAYSPNAQQRPMPDRLDRQQARQMLAEMVEFAKKR